jgi:hypothetical protein
MEPYHACRRGITQRPPVGRASRDHADRVEVKGACHSVFYGDAVPHRSIVVDCRSKTGRIDVTNSPDIVLVVVGYEYRVQRSHVRRYRGTEGCGPAWASATAGRVVVIYYGGSS